MIDFIQMIVSGVATGSTYALMGLAMVIIYKTSEVPNFAQGEMALITSYFAMMLLTTMNMSVYLAFFLSFLFAAIMGAFLEFAILRRA
ncbi:MAG: branched-chain amino acid ABC transporter permease, partial [Desulfobacula sp.]|nr:branched-chain amino acid ABC transporter permease [Desulfobacula sp.]